MIELGDRFWSKVRTGSPDECWEWQAATNESGYGIYRLSGRNYRAHRLSYAESVGFDIDDPRIVVRHRSCDNPPCCNPSHLSAGDQTDNIGDMVEKGRQRGSRHSRLSKIDIIRLQRLSGAGWPQTRIADELGVTQPYVSMILSGQRWREEEKVNG
ncbi:HNH endonuclease [Gordonia phage WilliamBoone]|nr:HNH endonuclease [Gordonia phage WilliamBoone]